MGLFARIDGKPPTIELMHDSHQFDDDVKVTISGVSFGTAYSGRLIVVGMRYSCSVNSNHNITATIGGVSATRIVNRANNNRGACMFTAQPSGASGTIVVTLSDAGLLEGVVGVWAVNFIRSPTPVDVGSDVDSNPLDLSLTVQARGVGCAIAGTDSTDRITYTWSGATEDFDIPSNGSNTGGAAGASFVAASNGTRSIIATPSGLGNRAGCSASFR